MRNILNRAIGFLLLLALQIGYAQVTITVGTTGQDFVTIQDAYAAIPNPSDAQYIIEINQSYVSGNEVFPISLGPKGTSANSIQIRPDIAATDINVIGDPGGVNGLLEIFDADYLTIDGRPGGVGSLGVLTLINTVAEGYAVVDINNDATNVTLANVWMQGETDAGISGMLNLRGGGAVTGQDFVTITSCKFSDIVAGGTTSKPGVAIYSVGNNTRKNDFLTISNCEFDGVYDGDEVGSFVIEVAQGTDDLTIYNNSFYQSSDYVNNNNSSGFIYFSGGENLNVLDNDFGGTAAGAAGGRFKVTSGSAPYDVLYVASSSGIVDVKNNLVSNFEISGTNGTAFAKMSVFYLDGDAAMNVSNNLIGDTSMVAQMLISPSGSTGQVFLGIYTGGATGNVDISGNAFGGIVFDGSLLNKDIILVETNNGDVAIDGNYFGGDQTKSLEVKPDDAFYGISNFSPGNINISNNEFKNIEQSGGGGTVTMVLCWDGKLSFSENNVRNLTLNGNQEHSVLSFDLSTQDLQVYDNRIEHISQSSTGSSANFFGFHVTSDANVVIRDNVFGSDGVGDISLYNPNESEMIKKLGGGTFVCTGNEIKNITANGPNAILCGINTQGTCIANISVNHIYNLENKNSSATSVSLAAICATALSSGNKVNNNVVEDIYHTAGANVNNIVAGIIVAQGTGEVVGNEVSDVTNNSTSTNAFTAYIDAWLGGTWDVKNNVILQNTSPGVSSDVYGIQADGSAVINAYHNTVVLNGSVSGLAHSAAYQDNSTGAFTIRNNVFANNMTGGLGPYTVYHNGGGITNDYNYLVSSDPSKLAFSTAASTLINWRAYTSGGSSSIEGNFAHIDGSGYPLTGFVGEDVGDGSVFTGMIVTTDKDGNARDNTPWMGAYEGNAPIAIAGAEEPGSGNALSFNGTQSFGTATAVSTAFNDFTQEFWFKWDGTLPGHHQMIVNNGNFGVNGFNVHLRDTDGEINLNVSGGGGGSLATGFVPVPNVWTHVAVSRTGGNFWVVYVNGEQYINSNSLSFTAPTSTTTFGEGGGGGFNYYGELDEYRYWSKERNINEIRQDMCSKIKSSEPDFSALDWYFRFDEGSGATLTDYVNESAINIVANWAISGAPIGDTSVFDYGSSSLDFGEEDQFSVDNYSPGVTGMHIYFVDDTVNNGTAPTGIGNFDEQGYYGVFKVGGSNDSYDAIYDYSGNPNVDGQSYEPDVRLITRSNNASANWKKATGPFATNTGENELRLSGQTGREYVIGLANTTYPDEPGSGYAIEVSGGDRIAIPDDPSLNFGGTDFTIEFWMYYTDNTTVQHIIDKKTGANEGYLVELNNTGQVVFTIEDNVGATSSLSSSPLNTDEWIHVACVYKYGSGSTVIYINGRSDAGIGGTAGINAVSSNSLVIGADQGGATPFAGRIDEVRIWGSTVGLNNVRGYMCSKSLTSHPNFATLRAYYRLDDNVNTTVQDLHGGNDGTVSVGVSWPFSGAPIGDTSIYNYSNASDLVLDAGSESGEMTIVQDVDVATCDSIHLYYVNDTMRVAAQVAPAGADSLRVYGYFGTFVSSNATRRYGITLDYTSITDAVSHPLESGLRLVGRGDHSMNSWGFPNGSVTTVDDISNLIEVDTIDGSAEIALAYTNIIQQPYYVNDGMGGGEIYTTNPGADVAGCGSSSNPCASLKFLLSTYELYDGDTVYVDEGNYSEGNITFANDTAVVIGAGVGSTVYDGAALGAPIRAFTVTVPHMQFSDMSMLNYNNSGNTGGALNFTTTVGGDLLLRNLEFDNNKGSSGGAFTIMNNSTSHIDVSCDGLTATRNSVAADGGAIAVFNVSTGSTNLYINNSTLGVSGSGNVGTSQAGAISFSGDTLIITNSDIAGNSSGQGGAIYSSGTIYLQAVSLEDNMATDASNAGGAIYINNGLLYADSALFELNSAPNGDGGAILASNSAVIIEGCEFEDNYAVDEGGSLRALGATNLMIEESDFGLTNGNIASKGGCIKFDGDTLGVFDCHFSNNEAQNGSDAGGAIYCGASTVSIIETCDFNGNAANGATGHGGALYFAGGQASILSSVFQNNSSNENGGAIVGAGTSVLFIGDSTLVGTVATGNDANNTGNGGGIWFSGDTLIIENSYINSNYTNDGNGAGLYVTGAVVFISESRIFNNQADASNNGGGIYATGCEVNIDSSPVESNTARTAGGIYLTSSSVMNIDKSYFYNNSATGSNAGAIYSLTGTTMRIFRTEFEANTTTANGAAIASSADSLYVENSLFHSGNDAGFSGVVMILGAGKAEFRHVTMSDNNEVGICTPSTTTALVKVYNSIVYNNTGSDVSSLGGGGTIDVENSIVGSGMWNGDSLTNTNDDPLFVDPSNDDYTITGSSPAIDFGNATYGVSGDFNDTIRPKYGGYDAGAFEVDGCTSLLVNDASDNNTCGTLRFAINHANSSGGPDTIRFDTVAMSGHLIQVTSALPTITGDSTVIFGDVDEDGVPDVEIDGSLLSGTENGLNVQAYHVSIIGLVVNDFPQDGIKVTGAGNDALKVFSSYIGLDFSGTTGEGNGYNGIEVTSGASNALIGDGSVLHRNVISDNGADGSPTNTSGIELDGNDNSVFGNYVGTDISGNVGITNSDRAIWIRPNRTGNVIGDTISGFGNVLVGSSNAVGINDDFNIVRGNKIGIGADGVTDLGATATGVIIGSSALSNLIEFNDIAYTARGIYVSAGSLNQYFSNSIYDCSNSAIDYVSGHQENIVSPVIERMVYNQGDTLVFGSASPGALIQLFMDDTDDAELYFDSTYADGTGNWSIPVNGYGMNVSAGLINFTATQDSLGNTSNLSAAYVATMCSTSTGTGTWNWIGANSTNWFDCGNWDTGSVPGINSDVVIPGTGVAPNQPLIETEAAYCQTISIDSDNGANVTLDSDSGATIEITNP